MVKIILIRHGQTQWNIQARYQGQSDVELSEKGLQQAKLLAEGFPFSDIRAVYSSDLSRAMYTAKAVAEKFHLSPIPVKELREISFGDWEGLNFAEIKAGWPREYEELFNSPDTLQIPHGESFPILQERSMKKIEELKKKHEGDTIVIVGHGAIIRAILAKALGLSLKYVWRMRLDNTSISVIRYDGDYVNVELMNSTAHLVDNSK